MNMGSTALGAEKAIIFISDDTRRNIYSIYDFKTGDVKTESLHEGWQTSGSVRMVRMAFNLYCNGTPSVLDYDDAEEQVDEPDNDRVSYYVIEDLSTWAENSPEKGRLERFESLPEAMAKFTGYRGREKEDKPDMARATFGFHVNGSEFDLIHVRNHENCLSLDFTHSRTAEESSRFMEDLQTLNHEVGFDKVRVHREMSPEEIKDFVKQRFEYQLKSSGLDDISLYMDRFDALYEQGKMEHLMPTNNQKHIVEDVPFAEWENSYIDANVREADRF